MLLRLKSVLDSGSYYELSLVSVIRVGMHIYINFETIAWWMGT